MVIAGVIVGVVAALLLAAFDVFWPFTVAAVIAAGFVWWFGHVGLVLAWLRPPYIAAYVVIGFLWMFFRWTRLVEKELRHERDTRPAHRYGPPKWSTHADEMIAYFFWWPIDAWAWVLSDLLRDAWEYVGRSFDRYAEWRFKSVSKEDTNG